MLILRAYKFQSTVPLRAKYCLKETLRDSVVRFFDPGFFFFFKQPNNYVFIVKQPTPVVVMGS